MLSKRKSTIGFGLLIIGIISIFVSIVFKQDWLLFLALISSSVGYVILLLSIESKQQDKEERIKRIALEMKEEFIKAGIEERDHEEAVRIIIDLIDEAKSQLQSVIREKRS